MSDVHLTLAVRNLIEKLKADLLDYEGRVVYTTDVDFSENDSENAKIEKVPYLKIFGMQTKRNDLFSTNAKPFKRHGALLPDSNVPSQVTIFQSEDALDLTFQIAIFTQKTQQLQNLISKLHAYFMNGKCIIVQKDPENAAKGENEYEIDLIEELRSGRMVNRSNLRDASGRIIIRGVLVSDGQVFKEGYVADTVNQTLTLLEEEENP